MREGTHPIWIAAGILLAVFAGYKLSEHKLASDRRASAAPEQSRARASPMPVPTARANLPEQQRYTIEAAPQRYEEPRQEVAVPPATREIYLCKSYGGGMFWSSAICSTQRATIDRIVTVPGQLSWDQQVAIAEGQKKSAEQLYVAPQATEFASNGQTGSSNNGECAALDAHIKQLDAMARQPQSGQMQDWIRKQRQDARSRQSSLRC